MLIEVQDHLKKGSSTAVVVLKIEFGIKAPDEVFRYAWLEQ